MFKHLLFTAVTTGMLAAHAQPMAPLPPEGPATSQNHMQAVPESDGKIPELKKAKNGVYQADWRHFRSFDLKKKKAAGPTKKMLGKDILLKGFVVPLEFKGKLMTEFFLVPYFPSCMHVPPPPANQMVHVFASESLKADPAWYAVEVTGKFDLKKKRNNDGGFEDAYFQLTAKNIKADGQ